MFVKNTLIKYLSMCGTVTFVCDQYIVMKIAAAKDRNPPLLLIFKENYKEVISFKDSEK